MCYIFKCIIFSLLYVILLKENSHWQFIYKSLKLPIYPFLSIFSVCSTKAFIPENVKTSLKALFTITPF